MTLLPTPLDSTDQPEGIGWDPGWAASFAPFAAAGRRPARVVAVHKDTSVVRDQQGLDGPATVSGRFRFDALASSDFPAVGDWVALEPPSAGAGAEEPPSSPCSPAGPRSCAVPPMRTGGRRVTSSTSR